MSEDTHSITPPVDSIRIRLVGGKNDGKFLYFHRGFEPQSISVAVFEEWGEMGVEKYVCQVGHTIYLNSTLQYILLEF